MDNALGLQVPAVHSYEKKIRWDDVTKEEARRERATRVSGWDEGRGRGERRDRGTELFGIAKNLSLSQRKKREERERTRVSGWDDREVE